MTSLQNQGETPFYFPVDPNLPKLKPRAPKKNLGNSKQGQVKPIVESKDYSQQVLSNVSDFHSSVYNTHPMMMMTGKNEIFNQETKVLLACIFNKKGVIITHDVLYRLFSKYGNVQKILIFEKAKLWKAFIQLDSLQSARIAKQQLNDYPIFDDGSNMNVYYSNMVNLRFQNNNSGGVDYSQLKLGQSQQNGSSLPQTQQPQQNNQQQQASFNSRVTSSVIPESLKNAFQTSNSYYDGNEMKCSSFGSVPDTKMSSPTIQAQQSPYFEGGYSNSQKVASKLSHSFAKIETPTTNSSTKENQSFDLDLQLSMKNPISLQQANTASSSYSIPAVPNSKSSNNNQYQSDLQVNHDFQNRLVDEMEGELDQEDKNSNEQEEEAQEEYDVVANFSQIFSSPPNYPTAPEHLKYEIRLPSKNRNKALERQQQEKQFSKQFLLDEIEDHTNYLMVNRVQNSVQNIQELINQNRGQNAKSPNFPVGNAPFLPQNTNFSNNPEALFSEFSHVKNTNRSLKTGNDSPYMTGMGQNLVKPQPDFYNFSISEQFKSKNSSEKDEQSITGGIVGTPGELDLSSYVNPLFLIENRKSKVIYVRGLQNMNINAFILYNLFSNFGNITQIMFLRNKRSALIEFENMEFATHAKDFLNGQNYLGEQVRIFYSNYENINLNDNSQEGGLSEDVFFGDQESHRFKKHRNMSINPPSCVLHISNLKKDSCHDSVIIQIFQQFGTIEGIKFITQNNYKNMCLIKFSSVEQALNAISFLHGKDIGGRQIQISFTRSQI